MKQVAARAGPGCLTLFGFSLLSSDPIPDCVNGETENRQTVYQTGRYRDVPRAQRSTDTRQRGGAVLLFVSRFPGYGPRLMPCLIDTMNRSLEELVERLTVLHSLLILS